MRHRCPTCIYYLKEHTRCGKFSIKDVLQQYVLEGRVYSCAYYDSSTVPLIENSRPREST